MLMYCGAPLCQNPPLNLLQAGCAGGASGDVHLQDGKLRENVWCAGYSVFGSQANLHSNVLFYAASNSKHFSGIILLGFLQQEN